MPSLLLSAYSSGKPLSTVRNITQDELSALVQWTDLILFDYITGHYDRRVDMFSTKPLSHVGEYDR